ncbi:hypothetical protein ACFRAR_38520 [Kitasatospora sp. NPDC056651]|uniref:hypothetical protein n=1 Tax=Kitasatospora sp. NPDC056651 TaxID=3345892 RepID=UPI0036C44652
MRRYFDPVDAEPDHPRLWKYPPFRSRLEPCVNLQLGGNCCQISILQRNSTSSFAERRFGGVISSLRSQVPIEPEFGHAL